MHRARIAAATILVALILASVPRVAAALDKQGSAHGGAVGEDEDNFGVSGAASLGAALYNPTYAARPNNTGLALMRYALHLDVDLMGPKLSIPLDVNFFTDRERRGLFIFSPTEFDLITGLSTTWGLSKSLSLEAGSRAEIDLPIDQAGPSQKYLDVRARLLYSLAKQWPSLGSSLGEGDISGWFTMGVFAYNPSYFARPDNTGRAFLRYGPHVELSLWHDWLSVGVDATMFTDRETNIFVPSELDLTPELIGHLGAVELHLAYERDMPVDRPGVVQQWVYALLVYGFDLTNGAPKPLEERGTIPSP